VSGSGAAPGLTAPGPATPGLATPGVATLEHVPARERFGCKGPRAVEWLAAHGIAAPARANTWAASGEGDRELFVARLGAAEFLIEGAGAGACEVDGALEGAARDLAAHPAGVYPVLREDWCLALSGAACDDVLVQVCNVQFAALDPAAHPVIMTLMVGVAVLVVPQAAADGTRSYRIWCDPTFGPYLSETLGALVLESGGTLTGVSS
jgi:sarcosine oxidase subunit gamma